jgi:hypothetical protein
MTFTFFFFKNLYLCLQVCFKIWKHFKFKFRRYNYYVKIILFSSGTIYLKYFMLQISVIYWPYDAYTFFFACCVLLQ